MWYSFFHDHEPIEEIKLVLKEALKGTPLLDDLKYDYGILLEISFYYGEKQDFNSLFKIRNNLKSNFPEYYAEEGELIENDLADYFAFAGEQELLAESILFFNEIASYGEEGFWSNFTKALFFKQEKCIEMIPNIVYENKQYWKNKQQNQVNKVKFNKVWEKFYAKSINNKIDVKSMRQLLGKIYRIGKFQEEIIHALFDTDEELIKKTKWDYEGGLEYSQWLEVGFIRYMSRRGLSFEISSVLWDGMMRAWRSWDFEDGRPNFKQFFRWDSVVKNFINNIDYFPETFAILWGSVYIFDYLKEISLIDKKTFKSFKISNHALKKKQIKAFISSGLWQYSFVHQWPKPDSISDKRFQEEKALFLKNAPNKTLLKRSNISEETL